MEPQTPHRHIRLETTSSTNRYARQMCDLGEARHGDVVRSLFQTHGKGHAGNVWESAYGQNLTFSLIMVPDFLQARSQFLLSMAVSLGIATAMEFFGISASIKWPNDLYVGNRKLGGILIENALMGDRVRDCIAGIGLNVNQTTFSEKVPNPTSMKLLLGEAFDLDAVCDKILMEIDGHYSMLERGEIQKLTDQYHQKLYLRGQESLFEDETGPFTGIIEGVNAFGQLIMVTANGPKIYQFKEVRFPFDPR